MVLAIAAELNLEVRQLDVKTAFLYADIEEEVYVKTAPGFETTNKDGVQLVMKLGKRLYGLAQSPQNWWKTIDPKLIKIGFVPLKYDSCVYIYNHNNTVVITTLYVDDLLVIGSDVRAIETIKKKLKDNFQMSDLGDVSLVLGMQITRDREKGTLTISQQDYTKSILARFEMEDCKPSSIPGTGSELSTEQPAETLLNTEHTQRYQAMTRSVIYLAQITPFNGWGGRGCNKFVPVLGGNGTKTAPTGDIFDQPPGQMRRIRGKLADHIGDRVVLSTEGAVLVTSPGTKSSYPRPPQSFQPVMM